MSITLTILGDASSARRAFGEVVRQQRAANVAMSATDRAASSDRRKTLGADVAATAKAEKDKTAAARREAAQRVRDEQKAARDRQKAEAAAARATAAAEKEKTRATAAESKLRARLAKEETREWERSAAERIQSAERAERRVTADAEKYTRQREQRRRREARERDAEGRGRRATGSTVAQTALGLGTQYAQQAHGMIQGGREIVAARERALDNSLVQLSTSRGVSATELRGLRARIMEGIRARDLDPDAAIAALGESQSFANILGGDTSEARRENVDAALEDVSYAAMVNPNAMTGTVKFGGMLRQRLSHTEGGEALRQRIMRSVTGIAFTGSQEEEDVLRGGLPAMLTAINAQTATARPEDADRITADVVTDFMANLEVASMSGGTSRLNANRSTTLRTAFNNTTKQDEIGRALARRRMTPEQQAVFARSFTRDQSGHYTMRHDLAQSGAGIASAILPLFDNDPMALANFMGPGGGGGRHQLLQANAVSLLGSYAGQVQNSAGQRVRQYDYVEEMKRQTITPESERTMRELRATEDATTLMRDRETALANTTRPGRQRDASNWLARFQNENPFASMGLMGALGAVAPRVAGFLGGRAATGAAALVAGGAALPAITAIGGTVAAGALNKYGNIGEVVSGRDAQGHSLSMGERAERVGANMLATVLSPVIGPLTQAISALPSGIRDAFATNPPVVRTSAEELAHAASAANSSGSAP